MSTAQLKEKVISKIELVDQDFLLEDILDFIELKTLEDKIYILNDEEKKDIEISKKQISEGNYSTNQEVFNELNEWLKK